MRNFAVIAMCALAAFAAAQDRAKGAAIVGFPETTESFVTANTENFFSTGNPAQMLQNAERLGLHVEVQDGYYLIVERESLIPYRKVLTAQIIRAAFLEPDLRIHLGSLSPAQRNLVADMFQHSAEPKEVSTRGNGVLEIEPRVIMRMNTDDGPVDLRMHINVDRESTAGVEFPESPIGQTKKLTNRWWNYSVRELGPIRNPVEGHTAYQEMLKKVIYDLEQEAEDTMSEISHLAQQLVSDYLEGQRRSPSQLQIGSTLPDSFQDAFRRSGMSITSPSDNPGAIRARESMIREELAATTGTLTSIRIAFTAALRPSIHASELGLVSVPLPIGG